MNHTSEKDAEIMEQRPGLRPLDQDERLGHLAAGQFGVLATQNARGFPQLSIVLYALDADARLIRISTRADRAKARNLARDPHAALFVQGPDHWSFVVAEGPAELSPVSMTPGDATGRELLRIVPQSDAAAEAQFLAEAVAEQRVVVRLHVERLYGDTIELGIPH
jgi:PPOX class probable F420-dependent enzyme